MLRTLPSKQTTAGFVLEILLMGTVLGVNSVLFGFWTGIVAGLVIYSGARALLRYVPFLRKLWYGITRDYPHTFDSKITCYLLPVYGRDAPLDPPYHMIKLSKHKALAVFDEFRVGTTEQLDSQIMYEIIEDFGEQSLVELPIGHTRDPSIPILAIHILDAAVYRTLGGRGIQFSEARIEYYLYRKDTGGEAMRMPEPEPDLVDAGV